jgi:cytochrome c oxidase subunit 4
MYFVIFVALLLLTATTVWVGFAPLGAWHAPAALGIAAVKATLVALYFMHLIHSPRLTWAVIGAAFFFLGILLVFVFADYVSRPWLSY